MVELWGGHECSVVRVDDRIVDQTKLSGHETRLDDLDRFAALGITRLRYPVVWDRVAPNSLDRPDWRWSDERLHRLRDLGVKPIVGLLHHGSGPRYASFAEPSFPERLAEFAAMVAERYPWIDAYTPVNEPLTTARFSGLYGLWYPHGGDNATMLKILVNQLRGVALAMRAVRQFSPAAQLVQTEDIGRCYAAPPLAEQAAYENERRWLSLDLLTGRIDRDHPMWPLFEEHGLTKLDDLVCPPDIIGVNHYLTSERYLDDRLALYPANVKNERYADVEAVRVVTAQAGFEGVLRETWQRYGLPIAVTEVHNGSTRDEQMRWLGEVWAAAHRLREQAIDIRAVTVWALLGSYDWNTLLVRANGFYEPGPFDCRTPVPRRTALGKMARSLATTGAFDHPALDAVGWWRRADRYYRPPVSCGVTPPPPVTSGKDRPLIIIGRGTLGQGFARLCAARGLNAVLLTRADLDIAERASVEQALQRYRPWAVINAAGFVRVDDAEHERFACWRENAHGPTILALACAAAGLPLVSFSSDLVFDGGKQRPYVESDRAGPLNQYGFSKVAGETALLAMGNSLVIRTSAFFGPWDEHNFVSVALRTVAAGTPFRAATDIVVSPTYVPDLINSALDLLIDGETGLWHLSNSGAATWAALADEAVRRAKLDHHLLEPLPMAELPFVARRPYYSVLGTERGTLMPSLDKGLDAYFEACRELPQSDASAVLGWR